MACIVPTTMNMNAACVFSTADTSRLLPPSPTASLPSSLGGDDHAIMDPFSSYMLGEAAAKDLDQFSGIVDFVAPFDGGALSCCDVPMFTCDDLPLSDQSNGDKKAQAQAQVWPASPSEADDNEGEGEGDGMENDDDEEDEEGSVGGGPMRSRRATTRRATKASKPTAGRPRRSGERDPGRNARMARENRERKKQFVQSLEKQVADLKAHSKRDEAEKQQLRNQLQAQQQEIEQLRAAVRNAPALAAVLGALQQQNLTFSSTTAQPRLSNGQSPQFDAVLPIQLNLHLK